MYSLLFLKLGGLHHSVPCFTWSQAIFFSEFFIVHELGTVHELATSRARELTHKQGEAMHAPTSRMTAPWRQNACMLKIYGGGLHMLAQKQRLTLKVVVQISKLRQPCSKFKRS